MANSYSLEELQKKYTQLKRSVSITNKEKENKINQYTEAKKELDSIKQEVSTLEERAEHIASLRDTYPKGSSEYKKYDQEYNNANTSLKNKIKEQEKSQKKCDIAESELEIIKQKYESLESELDLIKINFARDPRINQVLKESIEAEYNKKLEQLNDLIESSKTKSDNLNSFLKQDNISKLITELKEAYSEMAKFSRTATGADAVKATNDYLSKAQELSEAIKQNPEFKDFDLNDYINEILNDKPIRIETTIENKKQLLEERKIRVLEKIDSAKLGDINSLEQSKKDKEEEILKIANGEKDNDEVISNLEKALQNDFNYDLSSLDSDDKIDAEIAILDPEIAKKMPDELTSAEQIELTSLNLKMKDLVGNQEKSKADLETAKKDLIVTDYITDKALEKLFNKAEYESLYKEFFDAERDLRKQFLEIKGKDGAKKDDLDKAIQLYLEKANALKDKTGFSIKAWHDYLSRDIENKIINLEDGFKNVPEEYISNLSMQRFNQFSNNISDEDIRNDLKDSLTDLIKAEEDIFNGEKDETEYKEKLDNYIKSTNNLDSQTKTSFLNAMKGALVKVSQNLFGKLKSFFSKIMNSFKVQFTPNLQDKPSNYDEIINSLADAQKSFEQADEDLMKATTLTDSEREKRNELLKKDKERKDAEKEKQTLISKKQQLEILKNSRSKKASLAAQKATLENDRDLIQDQIDKGQNSNDNIQITDSGAIHDSKGSLYRDVRDSFNEER